MKKKVSIYIFILATIIYGCRTGKTTITPDARSYIRACADSINNITKYPNSPLPYFLGNSCLDYEKKYWMNIHKPLLIRKEIVDRVKSAKAIKYILNYGDRRITEKCGRQPDFGNGLVYYRIELLDKSFSDLLQERLRTLEK